MQNNMETLIAPILFVVGIAVVAVLIFIFLKWITQNSLNKMIEELPADVKREIRGEPTYTPFQDESRAELSRNNMKRAVLIILVTVVVGIGMCIYYDLSLIFALVFVAIFAVVIFMLLVKDNIKYGGKDLYEVRAYCDFRLNGKYNNARVFYYNFKTMMFEGKVLQNVSVGRELKAGQFCYVIVKVKNDKLTAIDISPREYVKYEGQYDYRDRF